MLLLSTAYFAPLLYYSKLLSDDTEIIIEKHENFNKQSYRNRCTIYTANGLLDLVVPIAKTEKLKIPISEVEISYDTSWQKLHFKAIESAYRRSPFYQYYIDDLMLFFNYRHRLLYDFNMQILKTVCRLIKIPFRAHESHAYIKPAEHEIIDMRQSIHPKVSLHYAAPDFTPPHYSQVFAEKWGFKPNLSILDLMFNTGPDAKIMLTFFSLNSIL